MVVENFEGQSVLGLGKEVVLGTSFVVKFDRGFGLDFDLDFDLNFDILRYCSDRHCVGPFCCFSKL